MKKVFLGIISGILLFLFGVTVSYRLALPNEDGQALEKYFIYMVDKEENDTEYILEFNERAQANLKVNKRSNGENKRQKSYEMELSKYEYSIVKKVLTNFRSTYKINGRDEYAFYFDYDLVKNALYSEDIDIMINMVNALENIALGEEKSGELTKREIGDRMLEIIEDEL